MAKVLNLVHTMSKPNTIYVSSELNLKSNDIKVVKTSP